MFTWTSNQNAPELPPYSLYLKSGVSSTNFDMSGFDLRQWVKDYLVYLNVNIWDSSAQGVCTPCAGISIPSCYTNPTNVYNNTGSVSITASGQTWLFSSSGILTVPGSIMFPNGTSISSGISGTTNYLSKFSVTSPFLVDSLLYDTGTAVIVNGTSALTIPTIENASTATGLTTTSRFAVNHPTKSVLSAQVFDGSENTRLGLFVNFTDKIMGLGATASSTLYPFVHYMSLYRVSTIFSNGNYQFRTASSGTTFTDAGYKVDVQGTFRAASSVTFSGIPSAITSTVLYYNTGTGIVSYGTISGGTGGSSFYQTTQRNSVSVTQRDKNNFSSEFSVTDNSGNNSSDIALSAITWSKVTNTPSSLTAYGIVSGDTMFDNKYSPVVLTTKGDLFTYSTTAARLGVGANATMLIADSAATTGNKWVALSGDMTIDVNGLTSIGALKVTNAMLAGSIDLTSKVTNILPIANGGTSFSGYTAGDLIYASSATALSKLGIGSNGQYLSVVSGIPAWATLTAMTNPMTTSGDTIYGGTGGTPTRLALGTQNYFYQAGANAPAWFNLFGTANTFTEIQSITKTQASVFYGATITNPTSTGALGSRGAGIKMIDNTTNGYVYINNGTAGSGQDKTLSLVSDVAMYFYSGAVNGNSTANFYWSSTNGDSSMRYLSSASNPKTLLELVNANGGSTYVELRLNAGAAPVSLMSKSSALGINNPSPTSTFHISGSFACNFISKSTNYTLTGSDYSVECVSSITITLPTAVGIAGREYEIINSSTATVTIATTASQTISGASTKTLATQWSGYRVRSNGTNWLINGTF